MCSLGSVCEGLTCVRFDDRLHAKITTPRYIYWTNTFHVLHIQIMCYICHLMCYKYRGSHVLHIDVFLCGTHTSMWYTYVGHIHIVLHMPMLLKLSSNLLLHLIKKVNPFCLGNPCSYSSTI